MYLLLSQGSKRRISYMHQSSTLSQPMGANILSSPDSAFVMSKFMVWEVKMHDRMSWHGTSLYFSMERSLNDREIRKTYISVSVSSLNIVKNEKPIFLLFRSLIYRKHSGFLWLFLYIETRNERKYRNLSYSFLFVNCYHSFALKSL